MDLLRRRPPTSALVFFGLATACAVAAIALIGAYRQRVEASRPDVGEPVAVVAAASDLIRGTALTVEVLQIREVPGSLVPPGSLTSIEDAAGQMLVADITGGEVITRSRLGAAGAGPVASLVPPGLRAFVMGSGAPEGTLRSGDLVDVVATYGAGGGRPYTDTVATAVQILRVLDRPETLGASGTDTGVEIVVLADPDTIEVLARASALGVITVSIAGPDAVPVAPTPSASPSPAENPSAAASPSPV